MTSSKQENMNFAGEAEQLAADYLVSKGYAIRERNWRPRPTPYEVDIIAQKGAEIVFVEVKARSNADIVEAVEAVDVKKQRFLVRAADIYLRRLDHIYYYRFDIMAVTGPDKHLTHIKDAFMPPLSSVEK